MCSAFRCTPLALDRQVHGQHASSDVPRHYQTQIQSSVDPSGCPLGLQGTGRSCPEVETTTSTLLSTFKWADVAVPGVGVEDSCLLERSSRRRSDTTNCSVQTTDAREMTMT
jgi:hypothetical protein